MRRRLGFDSETFPLRPGRQAPRVVCLQARAWGVVLRDQGYALLRAALEDPDVILTGHNIAFDALASIATWPDLLPLWIAAYNADRVTCTHERERLIRIAQGSLPRYPKNDLLSLCVRYKIAHDFEPEDKKKGNKASWRTRYHELDGVPVSQWPPDALRYATADMVVEEVYDAQDKFPASYLVDQFRQARAALWLAATSAWGMMTDARTVEAFGELLEAEHTSIRELLTLGDKDALARFCEFWNEGHPDGTPLAPEKVRTFSPLLRAVGSKDTKAAKARMIDVCRAQGLPVPITDTGKKKLEESWDRDKVIAEGYVGLDADSTAGTGDPVLMAYSRFVSIGTLRGRVERLRLASHYGLPIQPRFKVIVETGRTSCSAGEIEPGEPMNSIGDQTQNPHRSPGLRECYIARPGHVLVSSDWKAAELHTLAQCCLDLGLDSQLARVLNSGRDVHVWFGAKMLGWTYEYTRDALKGLHGKDANAKAKNARQGAKAANFGFPGGLGIEKFRLYAAKTYQVFLTQAEATALRAAWLEAFPEIRFYFAHVSNLIDTGNPLVHFMSQRMRGDVRYTSAANSYFQGRCADMAKDAGWRIFTAGLPVRIWNFAHDEILGECPKEFGHEVAHAMAWHMEEAGRVWCPGAPPKAEPALQRRWRKGAEPFYDEAKILRPWEDRPVDQETVDKIREGREKGKSPIHLSWIYGYEEARVQEVLDLAA
jgi:hypothetical protein